jgi:hypothetical protein
MKNRIIIVLVLGLLSLTLTNCGTVYQSARHTNWYDSSPNARVLDIVPTNIKLNPAPVEEGWQKLLQIGPGSDAVVTLRDGTLRGGKIITVTADSLGLKTSGQLVTLARSEIALVEVKGTSGALVGGLIGYLVGGIALSAILFGDEDVPVEGWILGTALLGIPTGLIGVLIGSQTGGDVEIVP